MERVMRSRKSLIIVLMLVGHLFFGCKSATEPEIPPTSPFGSLDIQVNPDNSLLKLKLSGTLLKQRIGSGVIDSLLPGSYTLEASADNYYSDTSIVQIATNNKTVKNVQLVQIPPFTSMITIPGGTFTMGCTSEQNGCYNDEKPTHQVTLSAYEIGKYEVTQIEWRTVMGTNPSQIKGDYRPVETVSWNDIITFCNTLSTREGLTPVYVVNGPTLTANWSANGYRLPTEAEWEYAARGGASSTNTQYSGSNTIEDLAWYTSNSGNTTHDVGTKSPNQLGVYDMTGNVWEWCWDWYSDTYYTSASQTNPMGPIFGSKRVLRGGSWNNFPGDSRVSRRINIDPDNRTANVGFRLVRTKN